MWHGLDIKTSSIPNDSMSVYNMNMLYELEYDCTDTNTCLWSSTKYNNRAIADYIDRIGITTCN